MTKKCLNKLKLGNLNALYIYTFCSLTLKIVLSYLNYRVLGTNTINRHFIQMIILSMHLFHRMILFIWDHSICQKPVVSDKIQNEKLCPQLDSNPQPWF